MKQLLKKIYLYAKYPYEAKYQFLIKKRQDVGTMHLNYSKVFIEEYNPEKKRKVLIVFDGMIADMHNNKKLNSIVTDLFIRCRKLNISLFYHEIIF